MYSGPVSLLPGASASLSGKATFFRLSFPWYARRIDFSQIRLSVTVRTGLGLCLQALGSGLLWGSPSRLSGLFALGTVLVLLSRAPSELSSSVTLQLYWVGGPPLSGLRRPSASVGVESVHSSCLFSEYVTGRMALPASARAVVALDDSPLLSLLPLPSFVYGWTARETAVGVSATLLREGDTHFRTERGYLVEPARRAG